MLNTDPKISLKTLAVKLKALLFSSEQTANIQNRLFGEAGRLIFDVLDISGISDIPDISVNIKKALGSFDY